MIFIDVEKYFVPMLFVEFITNVIVLIGGMSLLVSILNKITPSRYEFITWLMKFKVDEIKVDWLNNRFIVEMRCNSDGWVRKNIEHFINENYILVDTSDKSKPLYMTIDLTKRKIAVIITNT